MSFIDLYVHSLAWQMWSFIELVYIGMLGASLVMVLHYVLCLRYLYHRTVPLLSPPLLPLLPTTVTYCTVMWQPFTCTKVEVTRRSTVPHNQMSSCFLWHEVKTTNRCWMGYQSNVRLPCILFSSFTCLFLMSICNNASGGIRSEWKQCS